MQGKEKFLENILGYIAYSRQQTKNFFYILHFMLNKYEKECKISICACSTLSLFNQKLTYNTVCNFV